VVALWCFGVVGGCFLVFCFFFVWCVGGGLFLFGGGSWVRVFGGCGCFVFVCLCFCFFLGFACGGGVGFFWFCVGVVCLFVCGVGVWGLVGVQFAQLK